MMRGSLVVLFITHLMAASQLLGDDARLQERRTSTSEYSLTTLQWEKLDGSIDRALEYLATQQDRDGSFRTIDVGQPGVTSLCLLAFLSAGHVPDEGPYGKTISRAIDFVLSKQREDGLLFDMPIGAFRLNNPAHTGIYNHAIAGLMLSEVYGMGQGDQQERIRESVIKACQFTFTRQGFYKRHPEEQGGWRYLNLYRQQSDADLSITSWQLLFLRSARNAEFDIPEKVINDAMEYVEGCYDPRRGSFMYCIVAGRDTTPAMCGAGIVSLSMGGRHDSPEAQNAGEWMMRQRFGSYQGVDRYHYSAYYCSQAAFQLGSEYWSKFYPPLMNALVDHQRPDGSWDLEHQEAIYGNVYSTSLSILALTPPYQILPIYQR
ncbi:MAG: terpene cyclase/mutase family protein [Planctomycetaceae bacterium]|nr:terpene cyclase/mutase family protein [Planctomycetaceae bacterium]